MLATPPFGASSNIALWRANNKPPVELVVVDLDVAFFQHHLETDCNGATVGSILGLMNGFQAIDEMWMWDMQPVLNTSISRYTRIPVEELVDRTMLLIS